MIFRLALDSFHDAHLDLVTGLGLVVLPAPGSDVVFERESLHAAAWTELVERLAKLGWTPSQDGAAPRRFVGVTTDGRPVVEVRGESPILDADLEARTSLLAAAGVR
ncbi:MAG: hypothetical protein WB767_16825 [Nocardioides sp.]